MPWCPITKSYNSGEISIIPFDRDLATVDFDELTNCKIRAILSSYRNLEGHPVEKAAVIRFGDKPLFEDLGENEIEITRDIIDVLCFSGLANREYFQIGRYCNSDCFIHYGQNFSEALSFIGITSRRREGKNTNGRSLSETIFSIPVHASLIREVHLDEPLLTGLIAYREQSSNIEWARWQNAISCFNQANTDNDRFRYQVEWVLLCSAIEHLLKANSKSKEVAEKFTNIFLPDSPLFVGKANRKSKRWQDFQSPLRYEWIKEFYSIRGDFAHGKLKSVQPYTWTPLEHIFLATLSFPLIARILLRKEGLYQLSEKDQIVINIFESLADNDFLIPPPGRKTMGSWLDRLVEKERLEKLKHKMVHTLRSMRTNENRKRRN
jgi:hypothetical protein